MNEVRRVNGVFDSAPEANIVVVVVVYDCRNYGLDKTFRHSLL